MSGRDSSPLQDSGWGHLLVFLAVSALLLTPLRVLAVDGERPTTTTSSTTTTTTTNPADQGQPDSEPEEPELLPPPPLAFPVVGSASYGDTFGAPRDGGDREHLGTDIFASRGTPVVAAAAGIVEIVADHSRAGQYVVVRHWDGWRTAYLHLNNDSPGTDNGLATGFGPGVEVGARVQAGTLIGYVGDSGNAEDTPPHLHFELQQPDGLTVNAYQSLRAARSVTEASALPTVDYDGVVASGTNLVGHLDPGSGFNADISVADGHVYLGTWGNSDRCPGTGVRVIDVTVPAEPREVATFASHLDFPGTSTASFWVGTIDTPLHEGRIGIVGLRRCDLETPVEERSGFMGLAVYDLTEPSEPRLLSVLGMGSTTNGVSSIDVLDDGERVLVAATGPQSFREGREGRGSLWIVDMTQPSVPGLLSDWEPVRQTVLPGSRLSEVEAAIANSVVHVTWIDQEKVAVSRESGEILIVDVADRNNPTLANRLVTANEASAITGLRSRYVGPGPRQLVVNTVTEQESGELTGSIAFIDVTRGNGHIVTVLSPWWIGGGPDDTEYGYVYPGGSDPLRPDLTPVSWMSAGVRIVDTSKMSAPVEVGHFVPAPAFDPQRHWLDAAGASRFPMVWDVTQDDGYFYASDHHSGLWIFTVESADEGLGDFGSLD